MENESDPNATIAEEHEENALREQEHQNVFASPWDGSDMMLIVEDHELHVHKWILSSQSPVFKAMFNGHFKEASQDKVTLKEKEFKSMIDFLKLLYPSSMFGEPKPP